MPNNVPLQILALPNTRSAVLRFVKFAFEVYADWPHWVPPLVSDQVKMIHRGPFNKIGEKQLFLACRGDKPVARLSVHRSFAHNELYKENRGFFGFFEALPDSEAVAALFQVGAAWLSERGCTHVRGPMSFGIYDEIGLLIDAFDQDPVFLCPYNPPYYVELLEGLGFRKEIDWYAFEGRMPYTFPPFVESITQAIEQNPEIEIREADFARLRSEVANVCEIFNEAWAENWGHVPMSLEEFENIVEGCKSVLISDICQILYHRGEPVGFCITLPDLSPALKKANGHLFPLGWLRFKREIPKIKRCRMIIMGVRTEARNRGYHVPMIRKCVSSGVSLGFGSWDFSQIVETNRTTLRLLRTMGAKRSKTFRIYSVELARLGG